MVTLGVVVVPYVCRNVAMVSLSSAALIDFAARSSAEGLLWIDRSANMVANPSWIDLSLAVDMKWFSVAELICCGSLMVL